MVIVWILMETGNQTDDRSPESQHHETAQLDQGREREANGKASANH